MIKYDYTGIFQAAGSSAGNALPATETRSLSEALGYLAAINNGELRAPAIVEDANGELIKVTATLRYEQVAGKSDQKIFEMLDKNIDEQLNPSVAMPDPWNVDLNKVFPKH